MSNVAVRSPIPFLDISAQDWDFVLRTNLSASFHLAQGHCPDMLAQKSRGRIIHIVGGSNFFAYTTHRAHSIAAKAGMHGLTKALAHEFGAAGVTANTVAPGHINTERDWSKYRHEDLDKALAEIPLGRRGEPREVVTACVFLCSPGGSYVSARSSTSTARTTCTEGAEPRT